MTYIADTKKSTSALEDTLFYSVSGFKEQVREVE